MELSAAEVAVIDAFSHYVIDGKVDVRLTVGELIAQTGFPPELVNAALSRLLGRNWLEAPTKYLWDDDDAIAIHGEGLARAAALAARRELTLYEVKLNGGRYYVAYDEPGRNAARKSWAARAFCAENPGAEAVATASGITRAKARDGLIAKLATLRCTPEHEIVNCDE